MLIITLLMAKIIQILMYRTELTQSISLIVQQFHTHLILLRYHQFHPIQMLQLMLLLSLQEF